MSCCRWIGKQRTSQDRYCSPNAELPWRAAGSPILSREGWKRLLQEQGFEHAIAVGESIEAPALLSRQSLVLGVSDGQIQVARKTKAQQGQQKTAAKAKAPERSMQQRLAPANRVAEVGPLLRNVPKLQGSPHRLNR
jgi:hypothetical protein